MTIIMNETHHESLNDGRTTQEFLKGARYDVPAAIGQSWIARGWAHAVTEPPQPKRRATHDEGS